MKKLKQYNTKKEKSSCRVIAVGALLFLFLGIGNFFLRSDIKDPHLLNISCGVLIESLELHKAAVFLPGSGNNSARQDLNIILGKVLTKTMTDSERLSDSHLGIERIEEVQRQIEKIEETGVLMDKDIDRFEKNIGALPKKEREYAKAMTSSTVLYREKTREIEKFLYKINNDGGEIFERIIIENGALSEKHIIALNEHIPEAETNFDTLSFLYMDLVKIKKEIEKNHQLLNGNAIE